MKRAVCILAALLAACDKPPAQSGGPAPAATGSAATVELPKGRHTYYFGSSETKSNVSFTSKTNIMTILGTTNIVNGSATIDFEAGTGECHLIVPVAGLRTGMEDRDRAMWNAVWLDLANHKTLEFKSEKAVFTRPNKWQLGGKFKMKGIEKDLTIDAVVVPIAEELTKKYQFGDGRWIRVRTSFKINIEQHGMDAKKSIVPVETEWPVEIDLYATTAKPASELVAEVHNPNDLPVVHRPKKLPSDGLPGKLYKFGSKVQHTNLTAASQTALERVTAMTSTAGGWLGIDAGKGEGKVRVTFPVKTLRTGIKLRDTEMLGKDWLDAENPKHQHIDFESTKAVRKSGNAWAVEGNLTIRDVTKPVSCEVVMREIGAEEVDKAGWGKGKSGLGFTTSFKIKLSDFGIKVPEQAATKVNDEWDLSISLIALSE